MTASKKGVSVEPKGSATKTSIQAPARFPEVASSLMRVLVDCSEDASGDSRVESLLKQLDELESTQLVAACFTGADEASRLVSRGIDPAEDVKRLWASFEELTRTGKMPSLSLDRAHEYAVSLKEGRGFVFFCCSAHENTRPEIVMALVELLAHAVDIAVDRRTLELKVKQSQSEADHLQRLAVIGQSTASIVHEINNPLGSIVAYSDRLAMTFAEEGGHQQEYQRVQKIQRAAKRIHQFSRDLNNFGRPQANDTAHYCPTQIVQHALDLCDYQVRAHGIVVRHVVGDDSLRIFGAELPLTQVFVNLFDNACQAMADIGGELLVREYREGERWCVRVADEGCGIEEEALKHIFEPYFSTKSTSAGLGLGLSIVKRIVEEHDGTIVASQRPEGGMLFQIELPLALD